MKIIAIKYNKTNIGQTYLYQFIDDGTQYDFLFENFGTLSKTGLISIESPEELVEWFRDIIGDETMILASYWLKYAVNSIQSCNNYEGCSSRCDPEKRAQCLMQRSQSKAIWQNQMTWKFIDHALTEGFEYYKNSTDFRRSEHKQILKII